MRSMGCTIALFGIVFFGTVGIAAATTGDPGQIPVIDNFIHTVRFAFAMFIAAMVVLYIIHLRSEAGSWVGRLALEGFLFPFAIIYFLVYGPEQRTRRTGCQSRCG